MADKKGILRGALALAHVTELEAMILIREIYAEEQERVNDLVVEQFVLSFDDMKQKHKGAVIGILRGIKRKYEEII